MKKRILSIILALAVSMSMLPAMGMHAAASETADGAPAPQEQSSGSGTLTDPVITIIPEAPVDNGDGSATTATVTLTFGEGTDENGASVTMESTRTEEMTTSSDGKTITETWTEEGSMTTTGEKTEDVSDVTVDLTPALGAEEGADTTFTETSDPPAPLETSSDLGSTTVTETPREVTVTLEDVAITEGSGLGGEYEPGVEVGLEPVNHDWTGQEQHAHAPEQSDIYFKETDADGNTTVTAVTYDELTDQQKQLLEDARADGYDYLYIGHGEDSYFGADWRLPGDRSLYGTGTAQFQLVDPATGTMITAYCADVDTGSKAGYWYTVENLEDADYYKNKEGAEDHIRAIAMNGYWGTNGTDENGAPVAGSLEAVKAMLKEAGEAATGMTDAEIDALTEGQALTATQMAIWKYGNPYSDIDLESSTIDVGSPHWTYANQQLKAEGMTSEDIQAATNRIDALYNYLIGLSMPAEETGTTDIINEEKFIEDMSITVGEMVQGHANNADEDRSNDAYNVDLTFSLVVTPGEKDDLIVKVIDGSGQVVKTARIAGEAQEDEGFARVEADADGNYTLTGLELIEGSNTRFNLKLEGAQYLEEGVYIYTSEVRDYVGKNGKTTENVPSQTFVGIAQGYKTVDVSMDIDLTFHVEEGTVTTETTWQSSGTRTYTLDPDDPDPKDPDEPEPVTDDPDPDQPDPVEVPEEPVSQADQPSTGDSILLWCGLNLFSGAALLGIGFRKKED